MKPITLIIILLVTLACGTAIPVLTTSTPTAQSTNIVITPEPTVRLLTAKTALNIRVGKGLSYAVDHEVPEGTHLYAVCDGDWCYDSAQGGWFCLDAALGIGGCETP